MTHQPQPADFANRLAAAEAAVSRVDPRPVMGRVLGISGAILQAMLGSAPVGAICQIGDATTGTLAEVIGLRDGVALLSPFGTTQGLVGGAAVRMIAPSLSLPVGISLLGRVVSGLGQPMDGRGPLTGTTLRQARAASPDAVSRPLIDTRLATGLRALDAFCTFGRGQRLGIFGAPGAGKSVLLAALARKCNADVIVIGMIGERGREVREFVERRLPQSHRARTVVVASTSDRPPLERIYAAHYATAIAEDLRDQGKSVLLLIDSLTRVARGLREVGLSAGEPPTRRGYPASVYAALPELIERSGRTAKGDITAVYTVLMEGDGEGDPIAEEVRSLTDGHIMLSPAIAARGRYPAIDVMTSLSRLMPDVASKDEIRIAARARALLAKYAEIELLVQVGEYRAGSDAEADRAIAANSAIETFLTQGIEENSGTNAELWASLARIVGEPVPRPVRT
jgi:ATP synthase in type III secretion protein N